MKKAVAEFAGTFLLVFLGTGAIVLDEHTHGAVTHAGISATFGIAVFLLILLFGATSGAHLNPAVTLTQRLRKKISTGDSFFYITAQLLGGIAASVLLHLLFPLNEKLGATLPRGSEWESFLLEFSLTFLLMLAIIVATTRNFSLTVIALIAGSIVGLEALFAGPICGASMNPARSFAPALVSGHLTHLWLYFLAPVAGAITAAALEFLFLRKTSSRDS